jgi:ABC-type uncharacterized transport system substrate-binding protein
MGPWGRAVWLLALFMLGADVAQAHPHVFITARSELLYAPDGSITGVRHAWTFDEMFAAYALQGTEQKSKGVYTREELAPLAQTNVESLKEYAYFTFARADGKRQKLDDPVEYFLEYENGGLTLHFTLPLKSPVKAKELTVEVFDRSFFIDFQMAKQDPVKLIGASGGCRMNLDRPSDGATVAQKLNEQTFSDGGNNANFGAMFANKITVNCP